VATGIDSFWAAVRVTSKYQDAAWDDNIDYSRVSNVGTETIKLLELQFLFAIGFKLFDLHGVRYFAKLVDLFEPSKHPSV